MKIIAKTANGYIVEATADELAHAAGYYSAYSWAREEKRPESEGLRIGTVVDTSMTHRWMMRLREQEKGVRGAAAFMRQLADHVEAGLPSTIVPPPEEEAK